MLVAFVRLNEDRPRGERGGDSGVPSESWWKTLRSENRSKSTLLTEGLAPSMSSLRRANASVSRSASGSVEEVFPSSDVRGVASSRRPRVLRRSAGEVQASEAEGLKGREDGRCPQPRLVMLDMLEMKAIRLLG
jgi:hypothetical protein